MYALGNIVLAGASMADMFSLDVQKLIKDDFTILILLFNVYNIISVRSSKLRPLIKRK